MRCCSSISCAAHIAHLVDISVVLAFVRGDLRQLEQWGMQALEIGTAAGEPDAFILFGGHLTALRMLQGRLGELAEQTAQLAGEPDSVSVWRAGAALACSKLTGVMTRASWHSPRICRAFRGTKRGRRPILVGCRVFTSSRPRAEVYELVAPFAGQFGAPRGWCTARCWGLGARHELERYEQAEAHFAAAAEIEERFGAPLFLRAHAPGGPARSSPAASPRISTARCRC